MNTDEIRKFQATHRTHLGQPLKQDGDIGPQTQWALDVDAFGKRGLIIQAALDHVGLIEQGTNRGPEIDAWLLRCGAPLGSAWCAAFASAMASFGGINLHEASVARLSTLLGDSYPDPIPGDIFYWLNGDGTGHCGIVTGVAGYNILTCEGTSANGVRVWQRSQVGLKFLRTIPERKAPGIPPGATLKARGGQTR